MLRSLILSVFSFFSSSGGGGKSLAKPRSVSIDVVIKKKISNKKAISAVELEFISGTFLFPFAILITYLIEYPQLITTIFSLYHSQ